MTQFNLSTPVSRWVARHPETSRIFASLQIEYSDNNAAPLELACWERQLCPQQVVAELERAIHATEDTPTRYQ